MKNDDSFKSYISSKISVKFEKYIEKLEKKPILHLHTILCTYLFFFFLFFFLYSGMFIENLKNMTW